MSSHRVRRFVAKWDVPFAVFTVLLYLVALTATYFAFPKVSNQTIALLILLTGFTSAVSALAALLKAKEEPEESKPKKYNPWRDGRVPIGKGHMFYPPQQVPSQRPDPHPPIPD